MRLRADGREVSSFFDPRPSQPLAVSADAFAGFSAVLVSVSVQMILVAWSRILR
jgi:hypothetical protein